MKCTNHISSSSHCPIQALSLLSVSLFLFLRAPSQFFLSCLNLITLHSPPKKMDWISLWNRLTSFLPSLSCSLPSLSFPGLEGQNELYSLRLWQMKLCIISPKIQPFFVSHGPEKTEWPLFWHINCEKVLLWNLKTLFSDWLKLFPWDNWSYRVPLLLIENWTKWFLTLLFYHSKHCKCKTVIMVLRVFA